MGIPVLIMGKSGSGKSTSLRKFNENEIFFINVGRKPLPFKGRFLHTLNSDDYNKIAREFKSLKEKAVVIDDAGYLITNMFMKGHSAAGGGNQIFNFYNDLADRFWRMIEYIKTLPEDVVCYVIMHEENSDTGDVKPKTIGKLLDEKVCLEGMFTIVLRCVIRDDNHYFVTKGTEKDVSKTPMGMFSEQYIENDLKAVDMAIRKYYELGDEKNVKAEKL